MGERRWGRVVAAPHEFLIQIRNGRVVRAEQGGSCFRLPGDSIALVDTSVHRLQFTADQVTREKIGVAVTGLAVFRVVAPLLAYRTLDLQRSSDYHGILAEMFVGATRRLVANLTLEECLTRRKDALAAELMAEVAPVVGGDGRPEDSTHRGWGVAIDTIEVQDVRILSQEVFEALQAPYRQALALEALRARETVAAEEQRLAAARAEAEERARQARMALEVARLEAERARERAQAAHRAELAQADLAATLEREESRAASEVRVAGQKAQATRIADEARIEALAAERRAHDAISPERLQELLLTDTLPRMAEAFAGSFDHAVVTGGDMAFLGQGVAQVVATLRAFGLAPPTSSSAP
jgi:regulator of protease activity HflC (stomatin/prohibitin superfamily)